MPVTECWTCHHSIVHAEKFPTELKADGRPKTMPIDADSLGSAVGNLEVWTETVTFERQSVEVYKFRYLRQGEAPAEGHHRGVSHFATCAQADQWRRR